MTRERLEAALITSPHPNGRSCQRRRVNGIQEYLRINGPYLPAAQAAARLGVTRRTIERYRAALRKAS
jgi:hypothetical protein